ncbi:IS200/IS605 family transposase [Deinococcus cellulosilyticus]|uniref:IS200/IS605 family transposase n=1 Tax=Deinococcus cellulosilyticus (strain DSM 18568 / NBRC 106333 / KACC 11606 / 5516J-15) TaxID=1223518 RepID=A0A511MZM0_DEIC1|nr:IS200/IS605 family transposase [Deinococcus cellulosilyticus]GEM46044.1 IS200/IS605 family transposase [Deinococcus cellulosilyticus NBRC 106333 = KACC 11606]
MADQYKHFNTSVYLLNYHFVFIPKRRRKVLVGPVETRLKELLTEKCAECKWDILALEVMPDHVHLFLSAKPDVAPNQIMHALKGYTSRVLRREYPHLNTLPALWTRSFFVSTAGVISSKMVEKYIASQKTRDA